MSVLATPELTVKAGSGAGLQARVISTAGVTLVRANIASMRRKVVRRATDTSDATTEYKAWEALVVADVMLTALSTTGWGGKDTIGMTMQWDAPGSLWAEAGYDYGVIVEVTPNTGYGELFTMEWIVHATNESALDD